MYIFLHCFAFMVDRFPVFIPLLQVGGLWVPRVSGTAVHPGEGRLSSLRGLEWKQQLQNRAPAFLQAHQVRCTFSSVLSSFHPIRTGLLLFSTYYIVIFLCIASRLTSLYYICSFFLIHPKRIVSLSRSSNPNISGVLKPQPSCLMKLERRFSTLFYSQPTNRSRTSADFQRQNHLRAFFLSSAEPQRQQSDSAWVWGLPGP